MSKQRQAARRKYEGEFYRNCQGLGVKRKIQIRNIESGALVHSWVSMSIGKAERETPPYVKVLTAASAKSITQVSVTEC